uniref:Uncharacterized protein n=1 Tax=Junco hyemalis TaxID=40217 RepID=A0A8C5INL8_JUNHY
MPSPQPGDTNRGCGEGSAVLGDKRGSGCCGILSAAGCGEGMSLAVGHGEGMVSAVGHGKGVVSAVGHGEGVVSAVGCGKGVVSACKGSLEGQLFLKPPQQSVCTSREVFCTGCCCTSAFFPALFHHPLLALLNK